jgi:hypothetical protein
MKDKPPNPTTMSDLSLPTRFTLRQILYGLAIWTVLWTISCSLTSAFNHTFLGNEHLPAPTDSGPQESSPVPESDRLYKEIERLMAEQEMLAEEFRMAMKEKIGFEGLELEASRCNETSGVWPRRRGWRTKRKSAWTGGDVETEVWL